MLKVVTPAARGTVWVLPSPQLMVTTCVSSVPGSVKLPLSVVEPFSLMVPAVRLTARFDGATLLTVAGVLTLAEAPPPLSATLTLIG